MIAQRIEQTRSFMNHLLLQETFDDYCVSEVRITTFAAFSIDGRLHPDFYPDEEAAALKESGRAQILWGDVRPFCFSLIRGRRLPLSMHLVFQLSAENTARLIAENAPSLDPADVYGLFLNLQYKNGELTLTTGSSLRVFSADRSLDRAWDEYVLALLKRLES